MYCSNCGKEIPNNAKFCNECGTEVLLGSTTQCEKKSVFLDSTAISTESNQAYKPQAVKKKACTKRAIIVALLVCLLIILFAVLVFTHTICLWHNYSEATVVAPQTCNYCGKTTGNPKPLSEIKFPEKGLASLLPTPKSTMGEIERDNSDSVYIYIGNTTQSDFNDYVKACSDSGFDVDYQKSDDYYYAEDLNGNRLNLRYKENNVMVIQILAPNKDNEQTSDDNGEEEHFSGDIEKDIEFVIDLLFQKKSKVLAKYPDAEEDGSNVLIDGTFAGMAGQYRVCTLDEEVYKVLFIRDDGVIVTDSVIDEICNYLGNYVEYDQEWNEYEWETNKLEIKLYVDERIYFEPTYEWEVTDDENATPPENTESPDEQEQGPSTQNGYFTYTAHSFIKRFEKAYEGVSSYNYTYQTKLDNDKLIIDETYYLYYRLQDKSNSYTDIGLVSFTKSEDVTLPMIDEFTAGAFCKINILVADVEDVPSVLVGAMCGADPTLDFTSAYNIGLNVVEAAGTIEGYTHNNINYMIVTDDEYYYIVISPAE